MSITLICNDNMGSALARQLTRDGHAVRITARDQAKAQALADGPQFADGQVAPAFFAGDGERAKALIRSRGFTPVDAGPLKNARYLEPLAALNTYLGYGAGLGTSIAPIWIHKA